MTRARGAEKRRKQALAEEEFDRREAAKIKAAVEDKIRVLRQVRKDLIVFYRERTAAAKEKAIAEDSVSSIIKSAEDLLHEIRWLKSEIQLGLEVNSRDN